MTLYLPVSTEVSRALPSLQATVSSAVDSSTPSTSGLAPNLMSLTVTSSTLSQGTPLPISKATSRLPVGVSLLQAAAATRAERQETWMTSCLMFMDRSSSMRREQPAARAAGTRGAAALFTSQAKR